MTFRQRMLLINGLANVVQNVKGDWRLQDVVNSNAGARVSCYGRNDCNGRFKDP